MTPEEFIKAMQARQDAALSKRSNLPTFSAQRVTSPKSSQNDARLIISCNKSGFINIKFAQTVWRECTPYGDVILVSPNELAISIQGSKKMYSALEIALARILSHGAFNGVQEFTLYGQWDKFSSKTGNFTREQVMSRDFNTFDD